MNQFARLAIAAREAFPAALSTIRDWLMPMDHPHLVVHLLHESGMCSQHPKEALSLLDAIIADQSWPPPEFGKCLNDILKTRPDSKDYTRYQRLSEYARRHGRM